MEVSGDELAGVIDLFGALTPAELEGAIGELAFKRGESPPEVREAIERALANYRLVAIEPARGSDRDRDRAQDRDAPEDDSRRSPKAGATGGEPEQGGPEHGDRLLVPGPTAFPTLPAGAEDLPHILGIDGREIGRERLEASVEERFRAEAAWAVSEENEERIAELLDTSYDLEAWGNFELDDVRARLDVASAGE